MAGLEKVWVRDLVAGQLLDSTFAVLRKDRRRARTGNPFLSLELADRTGRVRALVFDDVDVLEGRFATGDTIRVLGTVEEYRGRPQVVIRSLERAAPGDALEYVPGARRDTEDLEGFVEFLIDEIGDSTLAAAVRAVYDDGRFRARFRQAPMSVEGHHALAGGALQHTVAVATICRELTQIHPRLDASVLGAAALTFAVGAADAFPPGPTLRLGDEGRLLGLAQLSGRRFEREAARLRTPRERSLLVVHCIVAARPQTAEAAALRGAIALDAAVEDGLRGPAGGSP